MSGLAYFVRQTEPKILRLVFKAILSLAPPAAAAAGNWAAPLLQVPEKQRKGGRVSSEEHPKEKTCSHPIG